MTKSTITREQAQKIIVAADEVITALAGTNEDVHPDDSKKMCELWDDLNDRHAPPVVVRELARMALAAMDSEPVAWTWHYREQWHVTNDKCRAEFVATDGDVAVLPLYRHAQPASVVDADDNFYSWFGREWQENYQHNQYTTAAKQMLGVMAESAWKAGRRAAMLQAEPVCTCPSGNGSLRWPCPVHPGSSPVIPDGYVMVPVEPNGDMLAAAQDAYGETDGDIASTLRAAMLAADPQLPGSDPATVPGKWIPVSEQMPEDEQEVLTINKMGHRFVSFFDKHSGLFFDRLDAPAACCIEHVLVTHWMPLPAAPQEIKS